MTNVSPASVREFAKVVAATLHETRDKRDALVRSGNHDAGWEAWMATIVPTFIRPPYASYHREFWDWVWSIQAGKPSRPFFGVWPRGFGKSSSIEAAIALLACRGTRSYGLYVSDTQEQADKHVSSVSGVFESRALQLRYPRVARRKVGKYGHSRGWRRNRLRTESGFTIDAIGLDTAVRGIKVEEVRPDLMIFDDIDGRFDSPGTVNKKIEAITESILPARGPNLAVYFGQNLIHEDGVVAQLIDGRQKFLTDKIISGPHPAIQDFTYEESSEGKWKITGGVSTWDAMSLGQLEEAINTMGISAFLRELQHDVTKLEGSMFGHLNYRRCTWAQVPDLVRTTVWVDPAVTDTDHSDSHGIQADGIAPNGDIYRLFSWEQRTSPEDAIRRATLKALELRASTLGVETDQGGDTWYPVYQLVCRKLIEDGSVPPGTDFPAFADEKAGSIGPKAQRASQMLVDYEQFLVWHVLGTHDILEKALRRYLIRKPYDLVDAAFWSWHHLRNSPTFDGKWVH